MTICPECRAVGGWHRSSCTADRRPQAEPVKPALPRDLRGTIPDHDLRLAAARRFAQYEIGAGPWVAEIINTYLDPAGTALIAEEPWP